MTCPEMVDGGPDRSVLIMKIAFACHIMKDNEFDIIFQEPTELPPPRSCDHSIPLIEGANPVFIRPYRYAPILKIEIERQVTDMLQHGII